jgi:hypothetical protein
MSNLLLIGNTLTLEVLGLRDHTNGVYYNAATVTANIKTLDGTLVVGPLTLTLVAASTTGHYSCTVPNTVPFEDARLYWVEVTADAGVDAVGFWKFQERARYRAV